jgi:thiol-disulfide isomerase/thioredoxin
LTAETASEEKVYASPSQATRQFQEEIVQAVSQSVAEGKASRADLEPLLARVDTKVAELRSAGEASPSDYSLLAGLKLAILYQLLEDPQATFAELDRLTQEAGSDEEKAFLAQVGKKIRESEQRREQKAALVGKPAPGLDFTWSTRPDLKSLADLKGKVVVLDFWATWCGPCIQSFPKVRELAEHYASSPVEVVGVTSIQGTVAGLAEGSVKVAGDPKRETELLARFAQEQNMSWTVAVSSQSVFNEEYGVEGIPFVAILAPDGTVRHTGLHPGMPAARMQELIDAILAEFNLPVPAAG